MGCRPACREVLSVNGTRNQAGSPDNSAARVSSSAVAVLMACRDEATDDDHGHSHSHGAGHAHKHDTDDGADSLFSSIDLPKVLIEKCYMQTT